MSLKYVRGTLLARRTLAGTLSPTNLGLSTLSPATLSPITLSPITVSPNPLSPASTPLMGWPLSDPAIERSRERARARWLRGEGPRGEGLRGLGLRGEGLGLEGLGLRGLGKQWWVVGAEAVGHCLGGVALPEQRDGPESLTLGGQNYRGTSLGATMRAWRWHLAAQASLLGGRAGSGGRAGRDECVGAAGTGGVCVLRGRPAGQRAAPEIERHVGPQHASSQEGRGGDSGRERESE